MVVKSHDMELKSHDMVLKSHDMELKSHDMVLKSHDVVLKSHDMVHVYSMCIVFMCIQWYFCVHVVTSESLPPSLCVQYMAIFLHIFIFFGVNIGLQLFVGIVVNNFNAHKPGNSALLTVSQKRWTDLVQRISLLRPIKRPPEPSQWLVFLCVCGEGCGGGCGCLGRMCVCGEGGCGCLGRMWVCGEGGCGFVCLHCYLFSDCGKY